MKTSGFLTVCFQINCHLKLKNKLPQIVKTKQDIIDLKLEKTQQQRNSSDCGIFAIAFATDLCYGIDPSKCSHGDGQELRSHFLKCLQEGNIKPFPSKLISNKTETFAANSQNLLQMPTSIHFRTLEKERSNRKN